MAEAAAAAPALPLDAEAATLSDETVPVLFAPPATTSSEERPESTLSFDSPWRLAFSFVAGFRAVAFAFPGVAGFKFLHSKGRGRIGPNE